MLIGLGQEDDGGFIAFGLDDSLDEKTLNPLLGLLEEDGEGAGGLVCWGMMDDAHGLESPYKRYYWFGIGRYRPAS